MILSAVLTNQNALLTCKHEKGLSKHEKGLSEHEKGLSDLNQSKMYRQFITKGSSCKLALIRKQIMASVRHMLRDSY